MNTTTTREFTDHHGRTNRVKIPAAPWDIPPEPEPTAPTFATKSDPVFLSSRIGTRPRVCADEPDDGFGSGEKLEKLLKAARDAEAARASGRKRPSQLGQNHGNGGAMRAFRETRVSQVARAMDAVGPRETLYQVAVEVAEIMKMRPGTVYDYVLEINRSRKAVQK